MVGLVTFTNDAGMPKRLQLQQGDLVAKVKGIYLKGTPDEGKLIKFFLSNGTELKDNQPIGSYMIFSGSHVSVVVVPHQPYAPVDYFKLYNTFVRDAQDRPKTNLPYDPNFWDKTWDKGDEWKEYPPVDVDNVWSTIPPSSSTTLAKKYRFMKDKNEMEEDQTGFRKRILDSPGRPQSAGFTFPRSYINMHMCRVSGFNFAIFHKLEGKWNGAVRVMNMQDGSGKTVDPKTSPLSSEQEYVISSRLTYEEDTGTWAEMQLTTSPDGISMSHRSRFIPHADGVLLVETDQQGLHANGNVKITEQGSHVLTLSAFHPVTGQPLVVETITCNADYQKRTRTAQRFDEFGNLGGVYVFTERKIIDAESGALTRFKATHTQ